MTLPKRLTEELHQRAPFAGIEEVAYLEILRTADHLTRIISDTLRRERLSATQYNALRILRGAGPAGLPCGTVGDRMITRDPDITRLLRRLEEAGHLSRTRSGDDRRVVVARITDQGRAALLRLDAPVDAAIRAALAHLGAARLDALIAGLEEVRSGPERAS